MMNFFSFSTLFLLTSSIAATPLNQRNGKWEHSSPSSSFASLDNVSVGFTMPSRTDAVPMTSIDTVSFTQSTASVSHAPSGFLTESSGDRLRRKAPSQNRIKAYFLPQRQQTLFPRRPMLLAV